MRIYLLPSRDHLMVSGAYVVLQIHLHMAVNIHHSLCNENLDEIIRRIQLAATYDLPQVGLISFFFLVWC